MKRKIIQIIWSVLVLLSLVFGGSGFSIKTTDSNYLYSVHTSPISIVVWGMLLILLFMINENVTDKQYVPMEVGKRVLNFFIDIITALQLGVIPISFVLLLIEYKFVNKWNWIVERTYSEPWDYLLGFFAFILCFLLGTYFSAFIYFKRQSMGNYFTNTFIRQGVRLSFFSSLFRTVYGFLVLCLWPFSLYSATKSEKKQMWHDKKFKTEPVKLKC